MGLLGNGTAKIRREIIEAVDDEWRASFYDLNTPEEIAAHIIYNKVVNRWNLSSLDGFADMPVEWVTVELES